MDVKKKTGEVESFDPDRVFQVVMNALDDAVVAQGGNFSEDAIDMANTVTQEVQDEVSNYAEPVDVSIIQDAIYGSLISNGQVIAAREYLHFSDKKMQLRADNQSLINAVDKVFKNDPSVVNENGNKDSRTLATKRDLVTSQVFRERGIKMYPKEVQKYYNEGLIYLHDRDMSPLLPYTNCCNVNISDMLENGFRIGETKFSQPHSIQVAVNQISIIVQSVSNSQYGGTSIPDVDIVLAPYAKMNYDKHVLEGKKYGVRDVLTYAWELTRKDIYEATQALENEINSLLGSGGGQTPFSTVSFGFSTGKFETEIQKAMLEVRIKGLNGKTAIFPKLIFFVTDGINLRPSDPNYDVKHLALKCSSERDYPDIVFTKNIEKITGAKEHPMTPMGCRSFLPAWKNPETGKEQVSGRLNLGVVTIDPVRIALLSKGDKRKFWDILKDTAEVAHKALRYRIDRVRSVDPEEAPILWMYGAIARLKPGDDVTPVLKGGRCTASLGYIGLFETVATFYGTEWENNPEAVKFGLSIVEYLHDQCAKWYDEEGYWYSLYSTPSENLTDRFCRKDRKDFGDIKDITDKGFYVNSFHYAEWKPVSPFVKLKFEYPYHYYATGGLISYVEYESEIRNNLPALEAVWDYANKIGVGYLGTNCPISKCLACGYTGMIEQTSKGYHCPYCGNEDLNKLQIVIRLCGYLSSLSERPVVEGRMKEIQARVFHNMSTEGLDAGGQKVLKQDDKK